MLNRRDRLYIFTIPAVLLVLTAPAFARGDKVIPQVADGGGIITRLDLVNVSEGQPITKYKLRFYHQDGSPWTIQTSLGTGSEFVLSLNPRQRLRVETLGLSSPAAAGYAVFRDDETLNSYHSRDLTLGITAYYATTSGSSVKGVVSVPASEATEVFSIPVEMNNAAGVYTGIAIVNLAGAANQVTFNLYATDSTTGSVGSGQTTTITLQPGQQRAEFLHEKLYPNLLSFKGVLEATASGPVSMLGLVQISTTSGEQYASITPSLLDRLRQDTNLLVIQPEADYPVQYYPIDFDQLRVDYFQDDTGTEGLSWDLEYVTLRGGGRQLTPVNGAGLVALDNSQHQYANSDTFDALSLAALRTLNYSTTAAIDLSGISDSNWGDAYAVRTNLGNYAKFRIVRIIDTVDQSGNHYSDLGLDVYVFK